MRASVDAIIAAAAAGAALTDAQALALEVPADPDALLAAARARRDLAHAVVSYSRKVFIPLTQLCRDVCHYCTFAQRAARRLSAPISRPTRCWRSRAPAPRPAARRRCSRSATSRSCATARRARRWRASATTTHDRLSRAMVGAGAARDRPPAARQSRRDDARTTSPRCARCRCRRADAGERRRSGCASRGGPHFGSPDKVPAVRLATIAAAGEAAVPFTTGILIGIGETRARAHRGAAGAARRCTTATATCRKSSSRTSAPSPARGMAAAPEPVARRASVDDRGGAPDLSAPEMNIQAPPNLSAGALDSLIAAGINDWGGVSPVTPDHVNPEAPWPQLDALRARDRRGRQGAGRAARDLSGVSRRRRSAGSTPALRTAVLRAIGRRRLRARRGLDAGSPAPRCDRAGDRPRSAAASIAPRRSCAVAARAGHDARARPTSCACSRRAATSFDARSARRPTRCAREIARRARSATSSTATSTTPTSATYRCQFCAFSKGKLAENLRGAAYDLDARRDRAPRAARPGSAAPPKSACRAASIPTTPARPISRSAGRVKAGGARTCTCTPSRRSKSAQGATTLGMPLPRFPGASCKRRGPRLAARHRRRNPRRRGARDHLSRTRSTTAQWLEVIEPRIASGLRTTATIMFGHVDRPRHWARHLLRIRALQARTGGFTEFVPLPFVHMEAPIYLQGPARAAARPSARRC